MHIWKDAFHVVWYTDLNENADTPYYIPWQYKLLTADLYLKNEAMILHF